MMLLSTATSSLLYCSSWSYTGFCLTLSSGTPLMQDDNSSRKIDHSSSCFCRVLDIGSGGGIRSIEEDDEDEKAKLDAMIEQLLQSVSSEDEREVDHHYHQQAQITSKADDEKSLVDASLLNIQQAQVDSTNAESLVQSKSNGRNSNIRKQQPATKIQISNAKSSQTVNSRSQQEQITSTRTTLSPPPPNAFYRFLLKKGHIGHIVLITLIIGNDWIERFVPPLYNLSRLLLLRLRIVSDPLKYQERLDANIAKNRGYTKESKRIKIAKKKREDELAYQKLMKVGSSTVAKYKHLSIDFLKRHGLGDFSTVEQVRSGKAKQQDKTHMPLNDEEEDSDTGDWIIDALATENLDSSKRESEGAFDLQVWSYTGNTKKAPTTNARFQLTGAVKQIKTSSSTTRPAYKNAEDSTRLSSSEAVRIAAAAAIRSASRKQRMTTIQRRQRISDRDGGSGVLGRLRAVTSESFISRQLMGAYPGDAPPIEAAGDARGLIDLARKYGYGECSDDDEVEQKKNNWREKNKTKPQDLVFENTFSNRIIMTKPQRSSMRKKSILEEKPFAEEHRRSTISGHIDRIKKTSRVPKLPLENLTLKKGRKKNDS